MGCTDGGDNRLSGDHMDAVDFAFQPNFINVTAGRQATISVSNKGAVAHNISIPAIEADLDFEAGQSTNLIFIAPESGPLDFFCKFHPDRMKGAFIVRG